VNTFTSACAEVSALLLVPLLLRNLLVLLTDHLELILANLLWASWWVFLLPTHFARDVLTNFEALHLVQIVSLVLTWTWLVACSVHPLCRPEKHLLRSRCLVRRINVWVVLTGTDLQAVPFSPLIHILLWNVDDVRESVACSLVRLESIVWHRNHRLTVLSWRRVVLRQVRPLSPAFAEGGVLVAPLTTLCDFDGALQLIVTRSRAIHFLWLQVSFRTDVRVEA